MSSDLIWLLTRENSAFLVKRNGVQFSRERGNLMNKHCLKYSGFNPHFVDVAPHSTGVTITTVNKHGKVSKTKLTDSKDASVKKVTELLKGYRPDLVEDAVRRTTKIWKSQEPLKVITNRRNRAWKKHNQ
jgi:large subunit ribosomal protein L28e